jgi:hypothetical protein
MIFREMNCRSLVLEDALEKLMKFKQITRLINKSMGASVLLSVFHSMSALIILNFMLAYALTGKTIAEDGTSISYCIIGILYIHISIIQICYIGDGIERKVRS